MGVELSIYREIGGLVTERAPRGKILSSLMDSVLKAMDSVSGTLYLYDKKKKELVFEVVKGPAARKFQGIKMEASKGIAGTVAKTGKPYISADLSKDNVWMGIKFSGAHKNMMAVPVLDKKKVIGVIQVIDKRDGKAFTRADLKVLTALSNHFSIIMERAKLFSTLDDKINQFSTLQEVGNLLISTLEQDVVRRRSMEAVTHLMRAETGSLLLVDEQAQQLYFEVALGEKGRKLKEIRLDIGEGIAGWVAKNNKPVIIPDVAKDRRFQGRIDKHSEFKTKNMICVPVEIKGKVIGVLQAINRLGDGTFDNDDLELFQHFSTQVAIALDNARLYQEIRETFYATAESLAEAIEKRDPYTGGHTKRVLEYCIAISRYLDLSAEELEMLKLSAVLHDIGKIGVEDSILRKQAPLDGQEASRMKQHPLMGGDILRHVPQLKGVMPGMMYHHERPDGKGYPTGLKNGEIPLMARIIAVADTYDAMTTTRPYRKGLAPEVALTELRKYSGTQFDSAVVGAFLKAFENNEVQGIYRPSTDDIPNAPQGAPQATLDSIPVPAGGKPEKG